MVKILREYIEMKIQAIDQEVHSGACLQNVHDPELKRRWKDESVKKDKKWREINTNQDVIKLIDIFEDSVYFVKEYVKYGHIEDGFDMMLGLMVCFGD